MSEDNNDYKQKRRKQAAYASEDVSFRYKDKKNNNGSLQEQGGEREGEDTRE